MSGSEKTNKRFFAFKQQTAIIRSCICFISSFRSEIQAGTIMAADKPKFDPNGELSQEARRRIQAQFGHVKDQDAKLFVIFPCFFFWNDYVLLTLYRSERKEKNPALRRHNSRRKPLFVSLYFRVSSFFSCRYFCFTETRYWKLRRLRI